MIRLTSLHKFYNKGRQNEIHVINNVDLELPERGMVALFGKSGCGKTTLLNVIGGLDRFHSGTVHIAEEDVRRNTDALRNRCIGYIFQNYNLQKNISCFDNVADALRLCGMTDKGEIEKRVNAALSNVGMEKYGHRPPDTLSGGQQQRIAIARAIVKNPRIILADEPTGNLDEANTILIMNLLKAISKDHLVLLVTHEANLVDYYCDRVIELKDGRVESDRSNRGADGLVARNKNDIYLGELQKTVTGDRNASVAYYGDAPAHPVELRVVNHAGKLYLQVLSPQVQVLDSTSELTLREGVYEEQTPQQAAEAIDMSSLPSVEGKRFGRLFTLRSAIKSGYTVNFSGNKKGRKVLKRCMGLFAAILVMSAALFGTSLTTLQTVDRSYNHNVFYVYTPTPEVSGTLRAALVEKEAAIDYLSLSAGAPPYNRILTVDRGHFETFDVQSQVPMNTQAVFLDLTLASSLPLVAGSLDAVADDEVVITTSVADALLNTSSFGYISRYEHLIGLCISSLRTNGAYPRIAAIVRSDEPSLYFTPRAMARISFSVLDLLVYPAAEYGIPLADGQTILLTRTTDDAEGRLPSVGSTVNIHGRSYTVSRIICVADSDYGSWLHTNGMEKAERADYFAAQVRSAHPDWSEDSDAFREALATAFDAQYFAYDEYYYAEFDAFLHDRAAVSGIDFKVWLAFTKGVPEAKYILLNESEWYGALRYKEQNGRYPTLSELYAESDTWLPLLSDKFAEYSDSYSQEYWDAYEHRYSSEYYSQETGFLLSDADYVATQEQLGDTTLLARPDYWDESWMTNYYTVVHSTDPAVTARWLKDTFPTLYAGEYAPAILTPQDLREEVLAHTREDILSNLISMAVVLALLCVCMFFIMRSALMNRIKEVGIYRAIGVSKRNLVFRFAVETLVLTTLTVFVGYLLTSAFLYACLGVSPLVKQMFFYPVWYAGCVLAVLYATCLLCGILPVLTLLRKTPSEILAQYDI